MTSARNQIYSDEAGDNFTFSHNYQQWKRPDQPYNLSTNTGVINSSSTSKTTSNSFFNNII